MSLAPPIQPICSGCTVDGAQTAAAGVLNGSVSFPTGLPSAGNYEVRLFSNDTLTLEAKGAFTVASGAPTMATIPNPSSGATGVALTPTLTWAAGTAATSHGVYFGYQSDARRRAVQGGAGRDELCARLPGSPNNVLLAS